MLHFFFRVVDVVKILSTKKHIYSMYKNEQKNTKHRILLKRDFFFSIKF